jgi:hypothetical protein
LVKLDDIPQPGAGVLPPRVISKGRSERSFSMSEELARWSYTYHVAIDAEGRVGEVRLAHSGPYRKLPREADLAFQEALRKTRYEPATDGGKPVPYHLITTIRAAEVQ